MKRYELTDDEWAQLAPLLPPQRPTMGRPAHDHRTIINGILWILRTGAPWRDLSERYGRWTTVYQRSPADGLVTVKVAVVRTDQWTRQRRRRVTWCLFVCLCIRDSLIGIRQRYRKRFGIESGYRPLEQLRIRTTSPNPALRLMVVGIALVLLNVWVWAQWGGHQRFHTVVYRVTLSAARYNPVLRPFPTPAGEEQVIQSGALRSGTQTGDAGLGGGDERTAPLTSVRADGVTLRSGDRERG